jgi:hypothetical protein
MTARAIVFRKRKTDNSIAERDRHFGESSWIYEVGGKKERGSARAFYMHADLSVSLQP